MYLKTKFQYYPANIQTKKPLGTISMGKFIDCVKNPSQQMKSLFKDIQRAREEGNLTLKSELKSKLYYFTPCVITDGLGRSYSNIISFTGFVQIDFDGIEYAKEFRDWFFNSVSSCVFCGVSPSGFGVKAVVRIPVVKTVDEYKEYFYGLGYYLEKYKGFDIAPQNCVLPLYLFHDPELRYRNNATVSTVRGEKINSFKPFGGDVKLLENVSEDDKLRVINIYKKAISRIIDNGHPQVLSSALTLYGYCGAGYVSEDEVEALIEREISNNDYLSKNIKGYIKSAKDMRNIGISAPLYLK